MQRYQNFLIAVSETKRTFYHYAKIYHTKRWQGVDVSHAPEMAMHTLYNHSFEVKILSDLDIMRRHLRPNLPWADDHFEERVCGEPLNPGREWLHWPFAHSADRFRDEHGQFSHTYMERFWPKYAAMTDQGELDGTVCDHEYTRLNTEVTPAIPHLGLRHEYGDLKDLVSLMIHEPTTRQGFLPVWFPEDTGDVHMTRKPCTLGYLFDVVEDRLNVTYYIRSCDLRRHFADDMYLTVRLLLWLREHMAKGGVNVEPGTFTMHIRNLHCFRNDYQEMFGKGGLI